MVSKKRSYPCEMADGSTDPQEKLDELTADERKDADAFREGRYAVSAADAYEAMERSRFRQALLLTRQALAKASRA